MSLEALWHRPPITRQLCRMILAMLCMRRIANPPDTRWTLVPRTAHVAELGAASGAATYDDSVLHLQHVGE